jgi:hypothetical protein
MPELRLSESASWIGSRVALGYCGEPFADFDTEVLKAASGGDTTKDRTDGRCRAMCAVRADVSHGSAKRRLLAA